MTYALFGRRALQISRLAWALCVALVLFVGPSFILWAVVVFVLGMRHPPTLDDLEPVGRGRALVAALGLAVFVISFVPNPFVHSWTDVREALRALTGR